VSALRQRLAKGGFGCLTGGGGGGGTSTTGIPHGAGRGDVIVHGNLVVQGVDDVNSFVKAVQRKGGRRGSSRRGVTPGVNSGMG
jgi:hydrogenase maturation factor HypE